MTTSRRSFLKRTAGVGALAVVPQAYAASDNLLRVGLVGCGGRGTGAAAQALAADPNVKLVAMADAFPDRIESSLATLLSKPIAAKVEVKQDAKFVGFNAYKEVIDRCDVVLLATPPHFRPLHLRAAVDAGKHVFAEKPVAVDGPGVRSVLESCERAKQKNVSVVSGLCLRYDTSFRECVKRIHDGGLGRICSMQATDLRTGRWKKDRQPDWSDMTYQMRNWYNFTWLSGDFNVEQHVHYLDVCAWVMGDKYPAKAVGMGGRQVLTDPGYGNVFDHFSIAYEYADGTKFYSLTRQQPGTASDMSASVQGSKGTALLTEGSRGIGLKGEHPWSFDGKNNNLYQQEHDELFAGIRAGKPLNNGEYMAKSTLLAIMGRMAAYTGKSITWEQALNSKEDLTPPAYDWNVKLPDPPIATPGVTKFA